MKKLWKSEKYRAYNHRRAERAFKRQSKARRKPHRKRERWVRNEGYYKEFIAPSVFSLIENGEETVKYFDALEERLAGRKAVYIDLRQVEVLTPDAIMYLLALMDVFAQQHNPKIRGSIPKAERPRNLLWASGFFDFLASRKPLVDKDSQVLSIRSGELVVGEVANKVVSYALDRLNKQRSISSKAIVRTLLECMGNTRNHAYDENLPYLPKWWVVAVHNPEDDTVSFAILDYGSGIPTTVRKKPMERFQSTFTSIDNRLVRSALQGEFRTRTKQAYRGKGLPSILDNYNRGHIKNLTIVSERAYVNYRTDAHFDLQLPLRGTLVAFDYSKADCATEVHDG